MTICSGKKNKYHDEIAFEGDNPDDCPLCRLIKEHERELKEQEQEHIDHLEELGKR